jgi:type IV pilus assembly protein PilB
MGVLGERELTNVLGEVLGLDVVDLRRANPEPDAIELVPEELTRRYTVVPFRINGSTLQFASAYKPSEEVHTLLAQAAEHAVDFVLAPPSDVRWAIDSSYRAIGGVDRLVQAFEEVETSRRRETDSGVVEAVDNTAPVVQVVARILTQAKRDRASDVHIEPSQDVVRVRFRIDGALKEVLMLPSNMALGLVSRIKIMAGMNIVERRRPQDGQLTVDLDGMSTDVRVSTAATI